MKKSIKITVFVLVLLLLFSVFSVGAVGDDSEISYPAVKEITGNTRYMDVILSEHFEKDVLEDPEFYIKYGEIYEYYSSDEDTPDYVLIELKTNMEFQPNSRATVIDNYILKQNSGCSFPLALGYGIYIPDEIGLYVITKELAESLDGFENVFTEAGIGRLIGDADYDNELTIKDSTYIQKCLAGVEKFAEDDYIAYFEGKENTPLYVSDINRDHELNIKDATAIQKYIAGLEY